MAIENCQRKTPHHCLCGIELSARMPPQFRQDRDSAQMFLKYTLQHPGSGVLSARSSRDNISQPCVRKSARANASLILAQFLNDTAEQYQRHIKASTAHINFNKVPW